MKPGERNHAISQGSASGLISEIRTEGEKRVKEIDERMRNEIMEMEDALKVELEEYEREVLEDTRSKIYSEKNKIENRSMVERKKARLNVINEIIDCMIDRALHEFVFKNREKYENFLKDSIIYSLSKITGGKILILISGRDLPLKDEILGHSGKIFSGKQEIKIEIDETIKMGGCVIIDEENKISYNTTLDRRVERMYETVRREVFILLSQEGAIDEAEKYRENN